MSSAEYKRHYRKANPERFSEQDRRLRHGLRPDDWARLWAEQDGRCYLCGDPLPEGGGRLVVVEHDHRCCPQGRSCSRCRRGLAHNSCNTIVGLADDDPKRLRRIAVNLERALRKVSTRPPPGLFDLADLTRDGPAAKPGRPTHDSPPPPQQQGPAVSLQRGAASGGEPR